MKRRLTSMLLAAYFIAVTDVCFAQNIVTQDSVQTTDKNLESAKKPVIPSGKTILADMNFMLVLLVIVVVSCRNDLAKNKETLLITCCPFCKIATKETSPPLRSFAKPPEHCTQAGDSAE